MKIVSPDIKEDEPGDRDAWWVNNVKDRCRGFGDYLIHITVKMSS